MPDPYPPEMVDIRKYRDTHGRVPFDDWINGLRDIRAKQRLQVRIKRLSLGLEGDWKSISNGIREMRVTEGKGYRLYYSWIDETTVLLLCGGGKSTQKHDVKDAIRYLRDYHG